MNRLKALRKARERRNYIKSLDQAVFNVDEVLQFKYFVVKWIDREDGEMKVEKFKYDELLKGDMVMINDKPYYSTGERDAFVYHFSAIDNPKEDMITYLMTGDYVDLSVNIYGLIETSQGET